MEESRGWQGEGGSHLWPVPQEALLPREQPGERLSCCGAIVTCCLFLPSVAVWNLLCLHNLNTEAKILIFLLEIQKRY